MKKNQNFAKKRLLNKDRLIFDFKEYCKNKGSFWAMSKHTWDFASFANMGQASGLKTSRVEKIEL